MENVATKVNISESSILADEAFRLAPQSPLANATVYSQYKEMPPDVKMAIAVYDGKIDVIKKGVANIDSLANLIEAKTELINVLIKPYGKKILPIIERKTK